MDTKATFTNEELGVKAEAITFEDFGYITVILTDTDANETLPYAKRFPLDMEDEAIAYAKKCANA